MKTEESRIFFRERIARGFLLSSGSYALGPGKEPL